MPVQFPLHLDASTPSAASLHPLLDCDDTTPSPYASHSLPPGTSTLDRRSSPIGED
jgi:hypothetical protein